jgi:hypothetical protein
MYLLPMEKWQTSRNHKQLKTKSLHNSQRNTSWKTTLYAHGNYSFSAKKTKKYFVMRPTFRNFGFA